MYVKMLLKTEKKKKIDIRIHNSNIANDITDLNINE